MCALLKADFSAASGKPIKPLHGVNSGPMNKVFTYDARPLFAEAGIPFARLHDVEYPYGSGEFVDIPCIFRCFDADETDPANYNFGLTDLYLEKIFEVGCQPIFRLGVSIEHAPIKRHVYPPKDYAKWARICEHIIRHYTEGWADGYRWDIRYWEIWNEPDGGDNMWLGTPEEFYELYVVTARHLKTCFPHCKIGGAGFTRGKNKFIVGFMEYLAAKARTDGERVPLDFYSWHRYFTDVNRLIADSAEVDAMLAEYGYADAENVFDEWNYIISWDKPNQAESYRRMKTQVGAAFYAAVLCALQQETEVKAATYFEGDVVKEFCGIFETTEMCIGRHGKSTVGPTKGFYAFKAFNELYKLGEAVNVERSNVNIFVCAARGSGKQALLAVNYTGEPVEITFDLTGLGAGVQEVRLIDEHHTFDSVMTVTVPAGRLTLTLPLPADAVVYIGNVLE